MDDEFSLLEDNATEVGLPWHGRPSVGRIDTTRPDGSHHLRHPLG